LKFGREPRKIASFGCLPGRALAQERIKQFQLGTDSSGGAYQVDEWYAAQHTSIVMSTLREKARRHRRLRSAAEGDMSRLLVEFLPTERYLEAKGLNPSSTVSSAGFICKEQR
jgi:hypothetical protein